MLQPKRTKVSKADERPQPWFGTSAAARWLSVNSDLKATERCRLTARQIEAARRAMTRHIKRGGKIWIRVFPDKPITKKATGSSPG